MKLSVLLEELEPGMLLPGDLDRDITGIACDSRQVKPGFLFAAVPGRKLDGSDFIEDAIGRGAVAAVSRHEDADRKGPAVRMERGVPTVLVSDVSSALGRLAAAFHGHPARNLQIVGITGTNGKTTTAYIVRDILRAAGREPGIITTIEYEIAGRTIPAVRTTPDAPTLQSLLAEMVSTGCRSVAMEVSSHALVQKRTAGIDYDVAVFTNLTRDHLDYHGTMESYFEAKMLLFKGLGRGSRKTCAVVNLDDPWGRRLAGMDGLEAELLTYGTAPEAAVRAENVQLTRTGSIFRLRTPWGDADARTALLGRFNISNVLAAVGACGALGVDPALMVEALPGIPAVRGRIEEVRISGGPQVFVDYAHTDDALEHVLSTLREITPGRIILVFGCGGDRDKTKRPAMGSVAARLADCSIVTSDNPRSEDPSTIIREICDGYKAAGLGANRLEVIEDRAGAIKRAMTIAGEEDTVLIAGKGHESFQELANTTVPFDDRRVVLELTRGRSDQ